MAFETTIEMVEEGGCDPTGSEPIDAALDEYASGGTLLEFPPGRYLVEREHEFEGLDSFGIVGAGESHQDVQFVFPSGYSGIFLDLRYGRNWLIENVTVQQSDDHETGVGLVLVPYANLVVRDFEIAGFSPWRSEGGQRAMYIDVLESDGTAVVERFIRRGPAHMVNTSENYQNGCQALLSDEYHRGTLYLRDCHIENASENAFYCSRVPGDVRIENCFFKNNDNSAVRIAGEGSYIRDSTIIIDTANDHPDNTGSFNNPRGLWVEEKSNGATGGFAENCEFVLRSAPGLAGLLHIDESHGEFEVRNCRLYNGDTKDWNHLFVWVGEPGSNTPEPRAVTFSETSFVAEAAGSRPSIDLQGRSGSRVVDCCISGSGDGIRLANADGCRIERTDIDVTGEAIVYDNASAITRNVTNQGSCPLPNGVEPNGTSEDPTDGDSGGSTDDSTTPTSTLTIESDGGGVAEYEFTVTGELSHGPMSEDTIDGSSATGWVGPNTGIDDFEYSGEISAFSIDGPATVYIDGDEVDPSTLGNDSEPSGDGSGTGSSDDSDSGSSDDSDSDTSGDGTNTGSTIRIESDGGGVAYYQFTVSGGVAHGSMSEDTVDGSTASGRVGPTTGTDDFEFTGEIVEFSLDGPASVFIDEEEVDPSSLGDSTDSDDGPSQPELPNTVVLDGMGQTSETTYAFAVTGDVAKSEALGSIESADTISGGTVSGVVKGDKDGYRFSGDIEDFTIDGSAVVRFKDGETSSPSDAPSVPSTTFLDGDEVAAIKEKIDAGEEPWATAWSTVKETADHALGASLTSVVETGGGHYFQRSNDYQLAIHTKNRVRDLALAYSFSGDERYARKAINQLNQWFLDPDTYQEPYENGKFETITQYITIPSFLFAADLLRGHDHWSEQSNEMPWRSGSAESPEAALRQWALDWQETFRSPNCNNIFVWRAFARGVAGIYAGEESVWEQALEEYRSDCTWNDYRNDGSFRYEVWRDNGYRYQLFRMKAHAMFCELGRVRGLDLYAEHDLKQAFDYMAPYVLDPDDWPHGTGSLDFDRNHEAGVYELAYSRWQDPTYLDIIESVLGRPVDEGRLLGDAVTLTHGNRFAR